VKEKQQYGYRTSKLSRKKTDVLGQILHGLARRIKNRIEKFRSATQRFRHVKTSFLLLAPLEVGAMRLSEPLEFGALRLSESPEISRLGSAEEAARQRREQLRALEEGRRWEQQAAATSCTI
jgi:hypothetical protein